MKYNNSTDGLPSNVLLVDRREGLLDIRSSGINLVLWKIEEDPLITNFFARVDEITIYDEVSESFERRVKEWFDHPGKDAFLEEHRKLYEIMEGLQDVNESILSVMDGSAEGYNFHQDQGYSLNWTLIGPTALWVENQHVKALNNKVYSPPENSSVIRQLPPHHIAIYQGVTEEEREQHPEMLPFVHSRPDRPEVRRVLHQIYC